MARLISPSCFWPCSRSRKLQPHKDYFISGIILILDKGLRIVNANEKFFEFTKATRDEAVNKHIEGISFPLNWTIR